MKPKNKTQKRGHIKHLAKATKKAGVKCYSDSQMGQICTTGQYSTYAGNFYKNKEYHIHK